MDLEEGDGVSFLRERPQLLEETEETEHGRILYRATFQENAYVSYTGWCLFWWGLVLFVAYGFGIFVLLWIPFARSLARQEIRSRRFYITSENIVYKTTMQSCCSFCGTSKTEKHVLLPLITDVVLSQSGFQSRFGIWSVTIETAGTEGHLDIQAVEEAELLKKIILRASTAKRAGQQFTADDVQQVINQVKTNPVAIPLASMAAAYPGSPPIGYPPQSALYPLPTPASAEQVERMNQTLLRIEQLLERQAAFQLQQPMQPLPQLVQPVLQVAPLKQSTIEQPQQ